MDAHIPWMPGMCCEVLNCSQAFLTLKAETGAEDSVDIAKVSALKFLDI